MKHTRLMLALGSAVFLTSCNILNTTYTYQRINNKDTPPASEVVLEKQLSKPIISLAPFSATETKVTPGCTLYVRPAMPELPPVPIEEVKNIKPGDNDGLDRIQINYIKELREFYKKVKKSQDLSYQSYLRKCRDKK